MATEYSSEDNIIAFQIPQKYSALKFKTMDRQGKEPDMLKKRKGKLRISKNKSKCPQILLQSD